MVQLHHRLGVLLPFPPIMKFEKAMGMGHVHSYLVVRMADLIVLRLQ